MAVTEYTWNPLTDSIVEETDGAGNVLVTYTNKPLPYGPLVSQRRSGQTSYYHFDALGSTRLLTDDSQAITDTYLADAWGNEVATTGTTENAYRWCGRWGYQFDLLLGSYYVRARSYQPTVARWMSIDPTWFEESLAVRGETRC